MSQNRRYAVSQNCNANGRNSMSKFTCQIRYPKNNQLRDNMCASDSLTSSTPPHQHPEHLSNTESQKSPSYPTLIPRVRMEKTCTNEQHLPIDRNYAQTRRLAAPGTDWPGTYVVRREVTSGARGFDPLLRAQIGSVTSTEIFVCADHIRIGDEHFLRVYSTYIGPFLRIAWVGFASCGRVWSPRKGSSCLRGPTAPRRCPPQPWACSFGCGLS